MTLAEIQAELGPMYETIHGLAEDIELDEDDEDYYSGISTDIDDLNDEIREETEGDKKRLAKLETRRDELEVLEDGLLGDDQEPILVVQLNGRLDTIRSNIETEKGTSEEGHWRGELYAEQHKTTSIIRQRLERRAARKKAAAATS